MNFPSKTHLYCTEVDYTKSDINNIKNDSIIFTIYVCPSDDLKYYLRKYTNIAVSFDGMFSLITFIIIRYFCNYKYDIELVNSIFFFSFKILKKYFKNTCYL